MAVQLFRDSGCSTSLTTINGASDGTCMQFGTTGYGSYRVNSLATGCVVTFYKGDVAYCSSSQRSIAQLGQCYSDVSINQFSVDGCLVTNAAASGASSAASGASSVAAASSASSASSRASSAASGASSAASGASSASSASSRASSAASGASSAASAASSLVGLSSATQSTLTTTGAGGSVSVLTVSVTATASTSSTTSTASSVDETATLSTGAKAGIGIGAVLVVIALIAIIVYCVRRKKKQDKATATIEADPEVTAGPNAGGYISTNEKKQATNWNHPNQYELSPESRPFIELPADPQVSGPVELEVPGHNTWATPQELPATRGNGGVSRGEERRLY